MCGNAPQAHYDAKLHKFGIRVKKRVKNKSKRLQALDEEEEEEGTRSVMWAKRAKGT